VATTHTHLIKKPADCNFRQNAQRLRSSVWRLPRASFPHWANLVKLVCFDASIFESIWAKPFFSFRHHKSHQIQEFCYFIKKSSWGQNKNQWKQQPKNSENQFEQKFLSKISS
jgi:hypothetical protein